MRTILAGALAALAMWTSPALAATAPDPCAAMRGGSGDILVTAATAITPAPDWTVDVSAAQRGSYIPIPVRTAFCRVEGTIEGNIGFELWLPIATRWNGRLLGAGVGGDAGIFNYRDMSARLNEGFATLSTDSGHKIAQAHWMTNAKARTDYEHRATHLSTLAAKALVARFYTRPADHSYFLGCSGGGRQGLKEMQNYPSDYDGIVAGAPGPYMPLISVRMLYFALAQKKDAAGALSDDDWALYERTANRQCDTLDGVADGIVENPLACRFDTAVLLCRPGQAAGCMTAPKRAMLDRIVAAMPDEQGRAMDQGLLPGVRTRPGPPSPLLRAMWGDAVYNNPDWNENGFQRTADLARVNAAMPELRADKVAIAPFLARGKAIIYQGWQDPSVIAGPTVRYYAQLARANGGTAKLSNAVRLIMVPGMYHCRGGPGADAFGGSAQPTAPSDPSRDILWSVIRWVEQGEPPRELIASRPAGDRPALTRKLCPFPQSARYDGRGDPNAAESFACVADPLLTRMAAQR